MAYDGNFVPSTVANPPTIAVRMGTHCLSIDEYESNAYLGQSEPNPATNEVRIPFELNTSNNVVVQVYDVTGKQVFESDMGNLGAGPIALHMDLTLFDAGVYTYTLFAGDEKYSKRMVIVR